jgi:hypothetical protein
MTAVLLAGLLVAVAAGVRSTWSPCGLSMLSSITPLGERGRGNRYRTTAWWYVAGAAAGGLTTGALCALGALAVSLGRPDPSLLVALCAALCVVAAASDARVGGFSLPIHRRQVNERWLDAFRPWVYGAGFGWQIGTGVATYIMTAGVYALVCIAVLSGSPLAALGMWFVFGAVRGLAVFLSARVRTQAALRALHLRFEALGPTLRTVTVAVELAAAAVLAAWIWWPAAVVAVALGACTAGYALTRRARRSGPVLRRAAG